MKEELGILLLREARDPRLVGVTVTEVEISPDLGHARVFISLIGDEAERTGALEALDHASGFLRRQLAGRLDLRRVPRLSFHLDESMERGQRILSILHQIEQAHEDEET